MITGSSLRVWMRVIASNIRHRDKSRRARSRN
jgi:hypothetical protein